MRSDGKKYILGGGLSGLIHAFYNPEFTVIEKEDCLGSRTLVRKGAMTKIVLMHADDFTKKLLDDIGVRYSVATNMIGYMADGRFVNGEITREQKLAIIRKKMNDPSFVPSDYNLSTEDYYIDTFEFDHAELVDKLTRGGELRFVGDRVVRITEDRVVTQKTSFRYDKLISTIPADIFWNLYKSENQNPTTLKSGATTFVLAEGNPPAHLATWDMLYDGSESTKYCRVSRKSGDASCLYEMPGRLTQEEVEAALPAGVSAKEVWTDERAIVWTNKQNIPPRNVLFSGRFAQWDHSIKLGDVVKQATFDCDFRIVWNRQMEFTSRFYDLNKLGNQGYRDELTKNLVLHLYPEISEILDGVNYKSHRGKKLVDPDHVKMEIVDAFKYLLNLMIVWGIDPQELFRLFEKKSEIVEERYKKMLEERRLE